ncbi:MAG: hypothetical protein NC218_12565, partial [Acetobacter sp.]|nr:hypothetical protein [Acetobacter sp.]
NGTAISVDTDGSSLACMTGCKQDAYYIELFAAGEGSCSRVGTCATVAGGDSNCSGAGDGGILVAAKAGDKVTVKSQTLGDGSVQPSISGLRVDGLITTDPYTFTMPAHDVEVYPDVDCSEYFLTLNVRSTDGASNPGTVLLDRPCGQDGTSVTCKVRDDDEIAIMAGAKSGYKFKFWECSFWNYNNDEAYVIVAQGDPRDFGHLDFYENPHQTCTAVFAPECENGYYKQIPYSEYFISEKDSNGCYKVIDCKPPYTTVKKDVEVVYSPQNFKCYKDYEYFIDFVVGDPTHTESDVGTVEPTSFGFEDVQDLDYIMTVAVAKPKNGYKFYRWNFLGHGDGPSDDHWSYKNPNLSFNNIRLEELGLGDSYQATATYIEALFIKDGYFNFECRENIDIAERQDGKIEIECSSNQAITEDTEVTAKLDWTVKRECYGGNWNSGSGATMGSGTEISTITKKITVSRGKTSFTISDTEKNKDVIYGDPDSPSGGERCEYWAIDVKVDISAKNTSFTIF